ncbi:hypothetical protein E1A91_A12G278800v1 [Gossypium mustelinum]|uniref:C2 domain-containing protein n=1 Tax=Gossypium mustelinum TaxID=34275 RepID=A0A5D2WZP6_GOSMU|nr:hypothetical protein E1A91_A12G278800v1 [Gossypium mustelinum]
MAYPHEIEVTLTTATNLKNVNWRYGPIRPYVVVWVDPNYKFSTKVDEEGDTSPTWNETLVLPLSAPIDDDTTLFIDVVHAGSEEDTKPLIGSAKLKLREVLDDAGFGERHKKTLQLKRPSGRPQGKVDVKVLIRESRYHEPDPYRATLYQVPTPPAAPPAYGYPYGQTPRNPYYASPPAGYPYSGYNYNVPPPYGQAPLSMGNGGYTYYGQEEKKSKFGGMGTGLAVGAVAGALGGLALAEGVDAVEDHIVDEVAEKVEDDLGFDNVGGADDF